MTNFIPQPDRNGLVKLTGKIRNLKTQRESASFVFTANDQSRLGILAIASALADMPGQAAIASHYASDLEEPADHLEFELDGQFVKGWVWRNPFREGDEVVVAAEHAGRHWELRGIALPNDRIVALYPHCSRGRLAHYRNAFKWWVLGGGGCLGVYVIFMYMIAGNEFFDHIGWLESGVMAFFGLMTFSLSRKWLPFVRVAEKVFRALDLPNPSSIDLVKSSKAQRRPDDPPEYGTFYFRY